MTRWRQVGPLIASALVMAGCTPPPDESALEARVASAAKAPPPDPALPPAADTTATLAELARRVAAIDADTASMTHTTRRVDLGAGATGTLDAWRTGPVWRRLRLDADGTGFRTLETYWLGTAGPLGARQETLRTGETPRVETIWFRDSLPYRWITATGRPLDMRARSSTYEGNAIRTRLADLLAVLADTMPTAPRPD